MQRAPSALATVAQWIEHQPASQRVAGLIPECAWVSGEVPSRGRSTGKHTLLFLYHYPSLLLSKNK